MRISISGDKDDRVKPMMSVLSHTDLKAWMRWVSGYPPCVQQANHAHQNPFQWAGVVQTGQSGSVREMQVIYWPAWWCEFFCLGLRQDWARVRPVTGCAGAMIRFLSVEVGGSH
jgi:hypothetical protein